MGDPANMRGSKSFDEKNSFEDRTTSASKVTRFLSEKLLALGVEERGAYCISTSETWSMLIRERFDSSACHLIGIHPVAVEDRTETQFIKIFFIWLSANTNILTCVCLFLFVPLITFVYRTLRSYDMTLS
jgi:hypothetical protein